jgi:hypothetical protein
VFHAANRLLFVLLGACASGSCVPMPDGVFVARLQSDYQAIDCGINRAVLRSLTRAILS